MKKTFTRVQALLVAGMALITSSAAFAQTTQTAGQVADRVGDQFASFANLATGGAFLVGIFVGIASLMKFKAYNENPQQTKISTPIVLALVAAGLIGFPAYLTMTKGTILDGDSNSLDNPVYQNIG